MNQYEKMWRDLGLNVELHNEVLAAVDHAFQKTVATQKNRPKTMAYFDRVIYESHGGRVAELIKAKTEGKKIAGTFCIYVPEEIALAASVIPIALCGGIQFSIPYAEKMFPRDICPLIKSTLGLAFSKTCPYAPIKNMAVGETTCDGKKKTWEILSGMTNFYVMEVPQKKEEIDRELWRRAVGEFKEKLESLSGREITSEGLADGIRVMNEKRRALQRLQELRVADPPPISGLDALVVMQAALNDEPVRFTQSLKKLNEELEERVKKGISPFPRGVKRIMVAGCPSVMGNWKVHFLIEHAGAAVVADETCTGSRYFENLVEEKGRDLTSQLNAIADRYLKINCACFTPNNERIEGVERQVKDYKIQGVVQYILQYCHGYNIEAIRVENALKKINLPTIKIETDYSEEDIGQLRTRIEAFLEKLS